MVTTVGLVAFTAGCGGGAQDGEDVGSSPPAVQAPTSPPGTELDSANESDSTAGPTPVEPSRTTEAPDPYSVPPEVPYAAVLVTALGGDKRVDFYDLDGQPLSSSPIAPYETWQVPTNGDGETGDFDLGSGELATALDPTFGYAVGTVNYGSGYGDRLPAELDVATGNVQLLVEPPDRSGFKSVDSIQYVTAAFNPITGTPWAIRGNESGPGTLIDLDTGRETRRIDDWEHVNFAFSNKQDEPLLVEQFSPPPRDAFIQDAPGSLTSGTDYHFDEVYRDEAGSGRYAFIAADPNLDGRTLFLWDGRTTPTELAHIDDTSAMQLIRFTTRPS